MYRPRRIYFEIESPGAILFRREIRRGAIFKPADLFRGTGSRAPVAVTPVTRQMWWIQAVGKKSLSHGNLLFLSSGACVTLRYSPFTRSSNHQANIVQTSHVYFECICWMFAP